MRPSGAIEDVVRIDVEKSPGTKGIHFNAKNQSDQSMKFAGVIKSTVAMTPAQRKVRFEEYLKALENRSAQFIWDWWRTGIAA